MWISKKDYNEMQDRLSRVDDCNKGIELALKQIESLRDKPQKECEKCGCLVGSNYVNGEPEIRTRSCGAWLLGKEYYIFKPIYCLRCAPKKKKAKK